MSIKRINEFPEGSGSLTNDDIFLFMDNPSGTAVTKKISLTQIASAIGGGGGGGGNPFDQNLNTTDFPTFSGISLSNMTIGASGITFADGTIQTTAASGTGGGSSSITVVNLGLVSGNITTPANSGSIFDLILSSSGILSNPINGVNGQTIRWRITYGGSGIPLTLDTNFRIPTSSSSPLPLSTISGVTDYLTAIYHSSRNKWDVIGFVPGY